MFSGSLKNVEKADALVCFLSELTIQILAKFAQTLPKPL